MKTFSDLEEELKKDPEFVKRYDAMSPIELDRHGNYWFTCQCYTEGIRVSMLPDPDDNSIGLSIWVNRMYSGRWGSFWQRLRWAAGIFRDILRDGRPNFTDILLEPTDARRLGWTLVALSGAQEDTPKTAVSQTAKCPFCAHLYETWGEDDAVYDAIFGHGESQPMTQQAAPLQYTADLLVKLTELVPPDEGCHHAIMVLRDGDYAGSLFIQLTNGGAFETVILNNQKDYDKPAEILAEKIANRVLSVSKLPPVPAASLIHKCPTCDYPMDVRMMRISPPVFRYYCSQCRGL